MEEVNRYKQQLEEAKKLSDTVLKYSKAVREKSTTKQVLLLRQYGSAKKLQKACYECCSKLNRIKQSINESNSKLEQFMISKEMQCSKCWGLGTEQKALYVRDRGSPEQRIIQAIDCPACKGKGKISYQINEESEALIRQLIEFCKSLDFILDTSIVCMRNLIKALGGDDE